MRRILAYIIDISIILLITSIININNTNIFTYVSNYSDNIIDTIKEVGYIYQVNDKLNIVGNIINFIILFIYTFIIPLLFKCTLGQKIMKLKYNLSIPNLFIKHSLLYGYLIYIISFLTLYILSSPYYFLLICLVTIIQVLILLLILKKILKEVK
ncbi:MAG: hypothetical protein IJZ36_05275 [Bacilli bacterium]|nr:hypothetical protein [Bacilli bacterium]